MPDPLPVSRRCALFVGHPGHELRVHHWIEVAKPLAFVLTDGSGRSSQSRLPSTQRVFDDAGATVGSLFGRFTDAAVYDHIRRGEVAPFVEVTHELARALVDHDIECVAGDALEGFNPSHELCRYMLNAAVGLARRETGRSLENFDFLLEGRPDECPDALRDRSVTLQLDSDALARKLSAARGYAELRGDTELALSRFGEAAFAIEMLRPVLDERQGMDSVVPDPPFYQQAGEYLVRAGVYESSIGYREHVQPLVAALWRQVGLADIAPTT